MRKKEKNKYIDCGEYIEMVLENRYGDEVARAKIDKEDFEKVSMGKWSFRPDRYPVQIIDGKVTLLHYVVQGRKKGFVADHINGDRLDNRKSNLRFATLAQNGWNRRDVVGVYFHKGAKKWAAQIICNNKHYYLGLFQDKSDAIQTRKEFAKKMRGEFVPQEEQVIPTK
jgi:hypothetical protein